MKFTSLFKRKKKDDDDKDDAVVADPKAGKKDDFSDALSQVDTSQMTRMQKIAFKMFQKLPRGKQEEMLKKAFDPRELHKNKAEILKNLDKMVESGQIDKSQLAAIKSRMGLR